MKSLRPTAEHYTWSKILRKIYPVSTSELMKIITRKLSAAGYSDIEIEEALPVVRAGLKKMNWKDGYCDIEFVIGF